MSGDEERIEPVVGELLHPHGVEDGGAQGGHRRESAGTIQRHPQRAVASHRHAHHVTRFGAGAGVPARDHLGHQLVDDPIFVQTRSVVPVRPKAVVALREDHDHARDGARPNGFGEAVRDPVADEGARVVPSAVEEDHQRKSLALREIRRSPHRVAERRSLHGDRASGHVLDVRRSRRCTGHQQQKGEHAHGRGLPLCEPRFKPFGPALSGCIVTRHTIAPRPGRISPR